MNYSWIYLLLLIGPLAQSDSNSQSTSEGQAQSRPVTPLGTGKAGFTVMDPSSLGISWTNSIPLEEYLRRQNLMNGAGLALGDYDGDGWCDIFLCNRFGPSALYRNRGNWQFEETTTQAGVACENQISAGAVFADVNGDGRLDLLVSSFTGPNALFLNLGNGTFTNRTVQAGITSNRGGTSMALGDLDGDDDLDLYLCHLGVEAIFRDGAAFSTRMVRGKPVVTGRFAKRLEIVNGRIYELGDVDYLFRNDGDGNFEKLSWERFFTGPDNRPMEASYDMGLAVQIRDINGDGLPDIYTCNDFQTPDRFWINQNEGRFRSVEPFALRNMSYASMGVDFADIDRDGHLDFVIVEMLSRDHQRRQRQASAMGEIMPRNNAVEKREDVSRNALYHNRGDGTYAEIAYFSGVAASDWSWTPIFLDVDLDGYEDLLISNGHLRDVNDRDSNANFLPPPDQRTPRVMQEAFRKYPELATPNAAFRNLGNLRFQEVSEEWGFAVPKITHGMALADLDNDGDQDIVANCANSGPLVYRNDSPAPRISVRLVGNSPNTQGIGARVTLHGGLFAQTQEIISGGRYVSGDDPTRTFAVPQDSETLRLEIRWRNDRVTRLDNVQPNTHYVIPEATSMAALPSDRPAAPPPLFQDVTAYLNHTHQESMFEDFLRQPLLPKKLTQLGPAAAWFDLNADGFEELIIGASRGGRIAVYENAAGELKLMASAHPPLPDDASGILGWADGDSTNLLIGMAQYERPQTSGASILSGSPSALGPVPELPAVPDSTGPMAMADIDGDGDLDLFIGGRFRPGHYPAPASSSLWLNEQGRFGPHPANAKLLKDIGLVSAAVFTDLNQDGFAELVLACEWGPVRVFKNNGGDFTEATSGLGLADHPGIWTSVTSGDFNGDGRMDLVAGNQGLNSYHQRTPGGPWYLYYGDPNGDGRILILEAAYDAQMEAIVPIRDMDYLGASFSWVQARFASHEAFSLASVVQILGEHAARFRELKVTTLTSTIFWNRGDHLEPEPLPDECQWTPLAGLNVSDFNGDGREDLFAAQNFFSVRPEDDRQDAGRGLLLLGSGSGKLVPLPGQQSGLLIYAEQRGSAGADFDGDGRTDLVVPQNNGPTRLFRNQGGTTGLRVRLEGPSGNPRGYGAVIHWAKDNRAGPAREVHCGSGYGSLDGAIQVLHAIPKGAELIVRWPGGKETRVPIQEGAKEIVGRFDGSSRTPH